MKILFDQGTLVPLQQHLAGHSVDAVEVIRMALAESRNCELGEFSNWHDAGENANPGRCNWGSADDIVKTPLGAKDKVATVALLTSDMLTGKLSDCEAAINLPYEPNDCVSHD